MKAKEMARLLREFADYLENRGDETRGTDPTELERIKRKLKSAGLSYRQAAPLLGVTYVHLSYVLNGHRDSRSLLRRIDALTEEQTHDNN